MILFLSLLALAQPEQKLNAEEQIYQKVLVIAYKQSFPAAADGSSTVERSRVATEGTDVSVIIPPKFRISISGAKKPTMVSIFDLKDSTPCSIEALKLLGRSYEATGAPNLTCYERITALSIDHRVRLKLLATELTRAKWAIEGSDGVSSVIAPALGKARAHLTWLLENTLEMNCCKKD
jgi:hypothetical protein